MHNILLNNDECNTILTVEKSLHEGREQEKKINWNYDGGKKSKSRDRIESKKMRQNKFYQCGVHVRVEWILFAVFVAPKTYIEHQPAHAPKTVKRKGARERKNTERDNRRVYRAIWIEGNMECDINRIYMRCQGSAFPTTRERFNHSHWHFV